MLHIHFWNLDEEEQQGKLQTQCNIIRKQDQQEKAALRTR